MALTNPIPSSVTNSLAEQIAQATDIRDIKPPIVIPNLWLILFAALAGAALVVIAYILWRQWQKRRAQPPVVPVIPPHERARRKLQEALDLYDRPKPFCTLVSDAVRHYLEERFGLEAPDRTTDEFLTKLKHSNMLLPDQKDSLQQFLSACDLVKFARYEPGRPELEALYNSALRLIEETEPTPVQPGNTPDHAPRSTQHAPA